MYSIALEGCGERQVYMLGPPNGDDSEVDFQLEYCESRTLLLKKLNDWFARHDPDAIIGWNVVQFDMRVLHEHARRLGVPLTLGRGGEDMQWREHGNGNHYFAVRCRATDHRWHRSAAFGDLELPLLQPGKRRANPARRRQGHRHPYQRMDEIDRMFAEDKPALAKYNLKDCELVTRIFAKTELLTFLLERASVTGLPVDRMGGSVAAFTHLLHAVDAPSGLCRAEPRR